MSNQSKTEGSSTTGSSLRSTVGSIAVAIDKSLSPGDVAELRRLRAEDPSCPAFWRIAASQLEPNGFLYRTGPTRDDQERRWAAILAGMARTAGMHRSGRGLGYALASAGYSELRFSRLLRAHGDQLLDQVRALAGFLASKAIEADWTDVAALVLSDDLEHAEAVRRRIARQFYSHRKDDDR